MELRPRPAKMAILGQYHAKLHPVVESVEVAQPSSNVIATGLALLRWVGMPAACFSPLAILGFSLNLLAKCDAMGEVATQARPLPLPVAGAGSDASVDAGVPREVPSPKDWPARLSTIAGRLGLGDDRLAC